MSHMPTGTQVELLDAIEDKANARGLFITDYGAVGDGETDCTAAFAATMVAANALGLDVFVPTGEFYCASTVTVPYDDMTIHGVGDLSLVTSAASSHAFSITADRVTFRRLKIEKTTTPFGACVFVSGTADYAVIDDVTMESEYTGVYIGDANGARTPLRAKVVDTRITISSVGDTAIVTRTGLDAVENAYHEISHNSVIQYETRPGIESWTGSTLIEKNRVVAPNFDGGTAGITVGHQAVQQIIGNYVEGFSFGIEAGNTGVGIVIDDNTVVACGTGIAISTTGDVAEEAVTLGSNVVIMTADYTGGNQLCINLTGCRTATVVGGALIYNSDGDYTDSASRTAYGLEAGNDVDQLNMVGVQMVNLAQGVRAGAVDAAAGQLTLIGCTWDNVQYPINDTGGSPTVTVIGGRMSNTYQSHHNYRAAYVGVLVERDADHPAINKGFAQFLDATSTVGTIDNCQFKNVLDTSFIADGSRAVTGNSYKRPTVEKRNGTWMVGNVATWTLVAAEITTAGLTEPYDVPIHTYSGGLSFTKTKHGVVTAGAAAPAAGTWAVGDKVYDTAPAAGGTIGWVCTTAGTPGTWKTFGAIAA